MRLVAMQQHVQVRGVDVQAGFHEGVRGGLVKPEGGDGGPGTLFAE